MEKNEILEEKERNENLISWLKFLKDPDMLTEEEMAKNPALRKAKEEYEKFLQDEHQIHIAELREKYLNSTNDSYREGVEDGVEQGEELGKEIGEQENSIKIAEKLLKKGMNLEEISEITELSKEKIKNIEI